MKLSDLKVNQEGVIEDINLSQKRKKRLYDLGLRKGVKVKLIRIAPVGNPIEIKLLNFYLAIRVEEADDITVKV